jgi:hypothetical protein
MHACVCMCVRMHMLTFCDEFRDAMYIYMIYIADLYRGAGAGGGGQGRADLLRALRHRAGGPGPGPPEPSLISERSLIVRAPDEGRRPSAGVLGVH